MTVNSNTQLELEKARNTRDFTIQEQQIRSDIAKKIYERRIEDLDIEKQAQLLAIDYESKEINRTLDDEAFFIETKQHKQAHHRTRTRQLKDKHRDGNLLN